MRSPRICNGVVLFGTEMHIVHGEDYPSTDDVTHSVNSRRWNGKRFGDKNVGCPPPILKSFGASKPDGAPPGAGDPIETGGPALPWGRLSMRSVAHWKARRIPYFSS
jgi:hypothetical protein